MPDLGTLNGQPVGFELPDPEPCEGCGTDIWWTNEAAGRDADDPEGGHPMVTIRGVYERDRAAEGPMTLWALKRHQCPLAAQTRQRRRGLLTGEPLDDEDDDD